jgi:hypothetical protein
MKKFNKTLPLVLSSVICLQMLTACGEFEALTPEALKQQEQGQNDKSGSQQNISEAMSAALIQTVNANASVVFGQDSSDEERTVERYFYTFDLAGNGKIQGISVTKAKSEQVGLYDVNVKVFARAASVNRELEFSGAVSSMINGQSAGFIELQNQFEGENLNSYISCLKLGDIFEAELRANEAFAISSAAACLDENCSSILVQLELGNVGKKANNSRLAFIFNQESTVATDSTEVVELSMFDTTMNSVVSYSEAELNKKEEVIAPACQASLNEPVVAAASAETVKRANQADVDQDGSGASFESGAVDVQSDRLQLDGSAGAIVEEVTGPSDVTSAVAEQDSLMNQAIDDAVRQANEDDPRKFGPQ